MLRVALLGQFTVDAVVLVGLPCTTYPLEAQPTFVDRWVVVCGAAG